MKRNVKNDKVLRAITIGLATMIAATSAPVTVLADTAEPTNGVGTTPETTPPGLNQQPSDIDEAQESVEAAQKEVGDFAQTDTKLDDQVAADLADATEALNDMEKAVQDENFVQALDSVAAAEDQTSDLSDALKSVYLEHSDKDREKEKNDRILFDVQRNEDGSLVIDEQTGNPVISPEENAADQLSHQYGKDNRSVQGLYQDGVRSIQSAITAEDDDTSKQNV